MTGVSITCPHCGFNKHVDRNKIPAAIKRVKCPKCQKAFAFEQHEENFLFRAPTIEPIPKTVIYTQAHEQKTNRVQGFDPTSDSKYCSSCGSKLYSQAKSCPRCGERIAPPAHALNKVALLLITFFLGGLGGHRIYQRKYLLGALYFLFFWTYIPAIVAFVEFIIYATKSEFELQKKYPETSRGAAVFAVVIPLVGMAVLGILAAIAIPQFVV
jgi:predicted Zn finger-like uncharacterized protein